jgi:hypothetical protein
VIFNFAQFSIPSITLAAGNYWLELHPGSSLTDTSGPQMAWANTNTAAGPYPLQRNGVPATQSGFSEEAFQLTGGGTVTPAPSDPSATPEPASMVLGGTGMILLAIVIKRWTGRCRLPK